MRLQDYLSEVTKIRLLEPAEERELWLTYKEHDNMESRHLLIEHYQPLVVKVLSHWRAEESLLMDLVQEGIIGLIEAVENFCPQRGVAFSLYATHRIRGRMLNYLQKESKTSMVSIDTPRDYARGGVTIAESLQDSAPAVSEMAERSYLVEQLRVAMDKLPNKERLALSGVFLEDQEPRTVASCLQITPSHLSRLQKQGIRRIRGMLSRLMSEMKK